MTRLQTKSIERIEETMKGMDEGTLRYQILVKVKNFKTSWIELGQVLYTAWKDKHYKEWGYLTFEAYTAKEIGIRSQTAMKLLRSYCFLEQEEPAYLKRCRDESSSAARLPSYETVDMLRMAKNKKSLDTNDYIRLRKNVLEAGKDPSDVRKEITSMIREREEFSPEEARQKRTAAMVLRILANLKSLYRETQMSKCMSSGLMSELKNLIARIEIEIGKEES